LDPTNHISWFLDWNSSLLHENVKESRNDEPGQTNGFDPDDQYEDSLKLDGHISFSSKGFHFVPQINDY
jgi:hypothetical protein